jgi:hypothetical protein
MARTANWEADTANSGYRTVGWLHQRYQRLVAWRHRLSLTIGSEAAGATSSAVPLIEGD